MTDLTVASDRTPELVERLVGVWERSVRATHTFLSEAEVAEIKPFVPQALAGRASVAGFSSTASSGSA
ncbi:MAG: hypothetical protein Q4B91_07310 [Atopobiaceae bacterium]|nr:hypothetical protein [Atopobiaceae bacterium]